MKSGINFHCKEYKWIECRVLNYCWMTIGVLRKLIIGYGIITRKLS